MISFSLQIRWGGGIIRCVMARINEHFLKLQAGYLFPEIGRRVAAFAAAHPEQAGQIIRCGIGDVTEPLPPVAEVITGTLEEVLLPSGSVAVATLLPEA